MGEPSASQYYLPFLFRAPFRLRCSRFKSDQDRISTILRQRRLEVSKSSKVFATVHRDCPLALGQLPKSPSFHPPLGADFRAPSWWLAVSLTACRRTTVA